MAVLDRSWLHFGSETPSYGLGVCRTCGADYRPRSEDDDLCYECQTAPVAERGPDIPHTAECIAYGKQTGRPEFCIAPCQDAWRARTLPASFECPTCHRSYQLAEGETVYCCDGWLWNEPKG